MKITGPGPAAATEQRRKASGHSGERSNVSFGEQVSLRPAAGSGTPPTTPLVARVGVPTEQEAPDAPQGLRQATRTAHGLLDELHQLEIGMVEGWVSESTLRRLAVLLDRRPALPDPDLAGVLDEVELRAAVELAKLRRGR